MQDIDSGLRFENRVQVQQAVAAEAHIGEAKVKKMSTFAGNQKTIQRPLTPARKSRPSPGQGSIGIKHRPPLPLAAALAQPASNHANRFRKTIDSSSHAFQPWDPFVTLVLLCTCPPARRPGSAHAPNASHAQLPALLLPHHFFKAAS